MRSRALSDLFALAVFVMAAFVVIGYALDIPTLRAWSGKTEMALPTATCLMALSASIILLSLDNDGQR